MRSALVLCLLAASACDDPCVVGVPGSVCAIAGTGEFGFNRDGLPAVQSDLYLPSAIRRGPDGRLYIMDFNNQRLRVIDEAGSMQTVVGNGFHAIADTTLLATDSPLENPIDFDFMPDGRLVFVSYHDPRADRGRRRSVAHCRRRHGEVGRRGDEGDVESPLVAEFIQLDGIAVTDDGDDLRLRQPREPRADDPRRRDHHGRGDRRATATRATAGLATDAELHWPTALALDLDGGLLIAEPRNHVVRKLAPDGTIDDGRRQRRPGLRRRRRPRDRRRARSAQRHRVAPDGTLYIADRGNFRVRRVAPDGDHRHRRRRRRRGWSGDGGPALEARFGFVARVSLDGDDLLVADQSNACARRIILR